MGRIKRIRSGRDVEKVLKKGGCDIRPCKGSHRVATLPDGKKLTYHDHGEYGKGMASKMTKALTAAGLFVLIAAYVMSLF